MGACTVLESRCDWVPVYLFPNTRQRPKICYTIIKVGDEMIYEMKVTLKHVGMPVWRKIQIDSNSTFYDVWTGRLHRG